MSHVVGPPASTGQLAFPACVISEGIGAQCCTSLDAVLPEVRPWAHFDTRSIACLVTVKGRGTDLLAYVVDYVSEKASLTDIWIDRTSICANTYACRNISKLSIGANKDASSGGIKPIAPESAIDETTGGASAIGVKHIGPGSCRAIPDASIILAKGGGRRGSTNEHALHVVLIIGVICPVTGRNTESGQWVSVLHDLAAVVDAGLHTDLSIIIREGVVGAASVDAFTG